MPVHINKMEIKRKVKISIKTFLYIILLCICCSFDCDPKIPAQACIYHLLQMFTFLSRVFCCNFQSYRDEVLGLDQDSSGIPNAISAAVPLTYVTQGPNDVCCPQRVNPDGTCFKCQ